MNKLALSLFTQNAKYQFGFENMKFKIPDLRYIGLFSQSIVFKTEGL